MWSTHPWVDITTTRFSKAEHVLKAQRNKAFGLAIQPLNSTMCGWSATVLFYSALNFVQAYLAAQGVSSEMTHWDRKRCIRSDRQLFVVWDDYRDLVTLSHKARYQMTHFQRSHLRDAVAALESIEQEVSLLLTGQ